MFREMRRIKQQVSTEECKRILTEEKRATLSVIGEEGYPYGVPVNFYYNEATGCIYIHGADQGHKADAIRSCDKVCLTVWDQGFKREGRWEWNVTSVVVFGRASYVEEQPLKFDMLKALTYKYYPSREEADEELASPAMSRVSLLAIHIDHMSGKLVNEK